MRKYIVMHRGKRNYSVRRCKKERNRFYDAKVQRGVIAATPSDEWLGFR